MQRLNQSRRSFTSGEMLRSPVFWLMYVMFVLNAATGLQNPAANVAAATGSIYAGAPRSVVGGLKARF